MIEKNTYKIILSAILIIAITALPDYLSAKEKPVSHKLKKHDSSLAISVDSVLYKLKQKQNITLVDIRKPEEFEKVRIPGSINIPLHAVKTKTYLKLQPVVLVNNGYQYTLLEKECKNLKSKGFKVKILKGGLNCWRQKGAPFAGDVFAQRELNKVSPRAFYQEKDFGNQVVIDVSKTQSKESKKLIPCAIHIPFSDNSAELNFLLSGVSTESKKRLNLSALSVSAVNNKTISKQKKNPFMSVLVFNEHGNGYEKVEKTIEKSGLNNVFYLKGGLKEYKRYLEHLALSRQPKTSRLKTVTRCKNCGKENKEE